MKFDSFVGPSYQSHSPNVDCERTVNLFLERIESGQGKNQYCFYKAPGLSTFLDSGSNVVARGALPLNGHVFFVLGDTLYDLLSDGTVNGTLGPLANDGKPVYMAANRTQLGIVSAGIAYYVEAAALNPVPWLVGINVSSIGFLDQYFLFLDGDNGDGFYHSEPGDISSGSALNFISAEASANKFLRLIVDQQRIWLFGELVALVFYDISSSNPTNPFALDPSGFIMQGTAAPASVTAFDNAIGWIGRSGTGQGVAWRNNGYTPVRISNHAVESIWATYSTIEDAVGWTCIIQGHTFWRIWFPTAGKTWQYDVATGDWTEVLYWNATLGQYEAHRGSCAASAFGKVLVGDRANGKIYEMSMAYRDDAGDRIRWLRRSPIIANENKRIGLPWIELDIETGVGDGSNMDPDLGDVSPEADPQVALLLSRDFARTWSNERYRSLGEQGAYIKRVVWMKNGMGRQTVVEINGSASCKIAINNLYLREPSGRST